MLLNFFRLCNHIMTEFICNNYSRIHKDFIILSASGKTGENFFIIYYLIFEFYTGAIYYCSVIKLKYKIKKYKWLVNKKFHF